ncbi:MAG TPA: hypothetical protein VKF79_10060 [Candidatus Acidoferrum sp.]|nr:hypothetical protein [Candidatus Acidoferrum sp.]
MRKLNDADWMWAVGVSLGTALLVVAPFFVLGIASGHDFEFHAASWLDAAGQWKEGIVFPAWTEWANHGFGEPRFIFYPPLSWTLGAALGSLLPWKVVPVVFIVLVQTMAGFCAFALMRRVSSFGGALFGAASYAANPYALLVVYMRSDFAEQLGTAFFPLLLLLALRVSGILWEVGAKPDGGLDLAEMGRSSAAPLQTRDKALRDIVWFAVVFALVWLSNAPAGVMASYSMALIFAWAVLRTRSLAPGFRGAAGLALGLALAAFYLVPAAYEQRWVNIEQALASGLQPAQNFLFTAIDDPEHTWFNWIASGIAILLMVLTGLAAVLARRNVAGNGAANGATPTAGRDEGARRKIWSAVLVLAGAATLLMLRPTNILWRFLPKLRFVQFPWRWMCVLAVCYAFFLGCGFARSRRGWILIVVATICSAGTATVLVQQTWWDSDDLPTIGAAILAGSGFDGTDEYDPRGDDHYNLPGKAPEAVILSAEDDDGPAVNAEVGAEVGIEKWTANKKEVRVSSPRPARLALRLLDYPAWVIEVNGRRINAEHPEGTAQILVPVGAGNSDVRVHFVRTADRTVGIGISLASVCAILALLASGLRRSAEKETALA